MSETVAMEIGPPLAGLVSPIGGVISHLERLGPAPFRSRDTVTFARLGDVGALRTPSPPKRFGAVLDGIGCHLDPEVSARIAIMEALERYAAAAGDERRWRIASAEELGPDAIDLTDAAQCADSERAVPGFPLAPWDTRQRLRWVRGWSLLDGRDVWVPAVMAHLGVSPAYPVERFWLQTSSGCAAGESAHDALLSACYELIERDAVAISWLQRLVLTRIDLTRLDLARLDGARLDGARLDGARLDGAGVAARAAGQGGLAPDPRWSTVFSTLGYDEDRERITLFDATSDLGLPTVLAVAAPPPGTTFPLAVGAACSDSWPLAALKALRELTVVRACVWRDRVAGDPTYPEIPDEAFAHLLAVDEETVQERSAGTGAGTEKPAPTAQIQRGECVGTVAQRLARVVGILGRVSSDVVAVELTPVELEGAGVRVLRVIAPALMPYLAYPNVRYLATARLYEAPRRMGHRVLPAEEVNPWPSPLW